LRRRMKMFAKFVKKQNKNGIKIIRAPVGEVENNWLKKQFYHHSDHVLKNLDKHWRNGTPLTIDEKKERLWHLIRLEMFKNTLIAKDTKQVTSEDLSKHNKSRTR
jgi:hypothetical protein